MKKKRTTAAIVGFVIILAVLAFFLLKELRPPEKIENLRIGALPDFYNALLYIAQAKGMFQRHGINLSLENYQAGTYAVNDLVAGKLDVAAASEFVLARQAFHQPALRAVSIISLSDSIEIVARRNHGIEKPEDLRGKRFGASKGTISDFFLSTFLSLNGIHFKEIQVVDLKTAEIGPALIMGRIDAAVNLASFLGAVKRELGENAIAWSAQSGQDFFGILITRDDLIKTRPGAITAFLKGVLEAEDYLKKHEKEAHNLIMHTLNLDQETALNTWARTRFRVGLDQNLLTLMEDEARWAITNKYVDSTNMPNYFNFLYLEGLKKIKPEAVSVIH